VGMMALLAREMLAAARALEFERAASLRDRLEDLATQALMAGALSPDEAARVTSGQREVDPGPAAAGLDPSAVTRGRPMRRLADGRPIRGAEADVVPGEDPVRRAPRKVKSLVPPRLKRKLR
jgi:UvrB/UvrC motif-containing protein